MFYTPILHTNWKHQLPQWWWDDIRPRKGDTGATTLTCSGLFAEGNTVSLITQCSIMTATEHPATCPRPNKICRESKYFEICSEEKKQLKSLNRLDTQSISTVILSSVQFVQGSKLNKITIKLQYLTYIQMS